MILRWLTKEHAPLMQFALQRMPFNQGASLGLQYPLIFSQRRVWCRYCNQTFHEGDDAMGACYRLNGVSPYPDAETLAEIDATP